MKKKKALMTVLLFLIIPVRSFCQFTPEELAARPKMEKKRHSFGRNTGDNPGTG